MSDRVSGPPSQRSPSDIISDAVLAAMDQVMGRDHPLYRPLLDAISIKLRADMLILQSEVPPHA